MAARKKQQKKNRKNFTAEEKFIQRIKISYKSSPDSESFKNELWNFINQKIDKNPDTD